MLHVQTMVKPSKIEGLGLFAVEFIPRGTLVWKFEPKLDLSLSKDHLGTLTEAAKQQFLNYAFFDSQKGVYILCGDDARFFNHSDNPNCDDSAENETYALRDIAPGEELTVNYSVFDGEVHRHLGKVV